MTPKYYLALFNQSSWREFLHNGGNIYGTNNSKINVAKKINIGDYLFCYITGVSEFVGVLEVTSPSYSDRQSRWQTGYFPVRLNVKIIENLNDCSPVKVSELRDKLSIFKNLKNPKIWGRFFGNTFNEFSSIDGEIIMQEIRKKKKKNNLL